MLVGLRFVRRSRSRAPRAQLHAAFDLLAGALDADLTPPQRAELERRLRAAATRSEDTDAPGEEELRHLAAGLLGPVLAILHRCDSGLVDGRPT